MSYTRIGRGPMGGDQYTQVHNGVFRDSELRGLDMGVFGHLSTHAEGWETSVEKIAEHMKDGVSAIKASLKRLEARHYLVRGQDQNPDGTFGKAWIFVTDTRAQLEALGVHDEDTIAQTVQEIVEQWREENRRSAPVAENRLSVVTSGNVDIDKIA